MSEREFMETLGLRVVEVDELGPDAQYLPSLGLLLLTSNLNAARLARVFTKVYAAFMRDCLGGLGLDGKA